MTEKEFFDNKICDDWIDEIRLQIYERDKGKSHEQVREERAALMKELLTQYDFVYEASPVRPNS